MASTSLRRVVALMPVILLCLAGCRATAPRNEEEKQLYDVRVASLKVFLADFESNVREKSFSGLKAKISPILREKDLQEMQVKLYHLSLSPRYGGLKLDPEAAGKMNFADVMDGDIGCKLEASTAGGRMRLPVRILRSEERWVIQDIDIVLLEPGDRIQLRSDEEKLVLATVSQMIGFIRDKRPGDFLYALPDTGAKKTRGAKAVFGGAYEGVIFDLDKIMKFDFTQWPDVMADGRLYFLGEHMIVVPVSLSYMMASEGDFDIRRLDMEFVFGKTDKGWQLFRVVTSGKDL
ncbi:MAG TPA: hypothetical protein PL033_01910 [Candidatus Brocadiia bacterium]|nr:hypothetical protein [Candidatus Brocadiia bacterium]